MSRKYCWDAGSQGGRIENPAQELADVAGELLEGFRLEGLTDYMDTKLIVMVGIDG